MPRESPFRAVSSLPDFPAQEQHILRLWNERRVFARLQAQNAGGPTWSFLDGPITANNPMGVHHAWGRAYKDLYQRFHAMLGHDQRWQNGFDCQGLWVEVNVERDLGFTSKRDIEALGIAEFISLCKQRVLTYAARQTEQSIRLGYWMDWNDPDELRRLRDLLAVDPARVITVEGSRGPVTDSVEMIVGRLGMLELGGSYFTFSNENNDLIWGFLAACHARGWLVKGHDTMPWCARCGTGISQTEAAERYQERDDPGLTVRLPLLDRAGESLLVWTTTPWTLTSNVAAAVGEDLTYVAVRQGEEVLWLGKGTLKQALVGPFTVVEERPGRDLVGWRYAGPFDEMAAVRRVFTAWHGADGETPYVHRVVAWNEVGEGEGTGIVHIAPGCGADDFRLGKRLDLPVVAPLDESGIFLEGFEPLTGRDVRDATEPIVERLRHNGRFYRLETIRHRYPHCWRCGTPLIFRLVDEWFISMGEVYDQPRETLSTEQIERSLRYQIMEIVDRIRWIPGFGHERELDWLLNMQDWMISKKRYWGLALPIYDCAACDTITVISGREQLRERAVVGWADFEGHTPHRPYVDAVLVACDGCGAPVERIKDVGNPWLDAGIVPFSTLHQREDPDYWAKWFPADFITESFPGQFRNWFYSMLAMSTVLRREPPFRTIFGYALVFGEDGRQMHKSWGNAIEFDEAADRIGVDVMRWMFARARPEENILFGWHAADEARRELLVLWNVYAFLVSYARPADWQPADAAPRPVERPALDRWILSRVANVAAGVGERLADYDAQGATRLLSGLIDDLSTWYLRLDRRRFSRSDDANDRAAAFATLHAALLATARLLAPILPFMAEAIHDNLATGGDGAGDSVHLTPWPAAEFASFADAALETEMDLARRAVELVRTLRNAAGLRMRQPIARVWLALPDGPGALSPESVAMVAAELNVKEVVLIDDESDLVTRRVKPLLPRIGKRLGPAIPAVLAAARAGAVEFLPGGGVRLAGIELAFDEVEIQATPRPGTAVANDDGLVAIIDTQLTDALRAEGDARELQRAIQEMRKTAGLAFDDPVRLWLTMPEAVGDALRPYLDGILAETLAVEVTLAPAPAHSTVADVELGVGRLRLGLARVA
jgi:isoleucyl-tRNA synthetase